MDMDLPKNLPTDNLYKFMAIFGLVLLIASFIIPGIYDNKIRNDVEYFYHNYGMYGLEQADLASTSNLIMKIYGNEDKLLTLTSFIGGIILIVAGFILWYIKTQKYLDMILKPKH